MRFTSAIKTFFICILSITLIMLFQNYNVANKIINSIDINRKSDLVWYLFRKREDNLKYILQWTTPKDIPFVYMGEGQDGFIKRGCPHVNCVVTNNRTLLGSYTNFDVIVFAGTEVLYRSAFFLPKRRSPRQKYVFASIESAHNYPLCNNRFNRYFNWTWTYKLDSEVRWGYIVVKDINNAVVGPNKIMHWLPHAAMDPVKDDFKEKLRTKTKAAAWFVSNCVSRSEREQFVMELKTKLLLKYKLVIDLYGACSVNKCPREDKACYKMIEQDYYFYLAFENAFSEDYVTEKLLIALQNDAVPIVFGGANYSRFLPEHSYLNGRELGIDKLAKKMYDLMQNPEEYAEYFRWKNHYSYHRTTDDVQTNEYCRMCAWLNNEKNMKKNTVYKNFRKWWDPPTLCPILNIIKKKRQKTKF